MKGIDKRWLLLIAAALAIVLWFWLDSRAGGGNCEPWIERPEMWLCGPRDGQGLREVRGR